MREHVTTGIKSAKTASCFISRTLTVNNRHAIGFAHFKAPTALAFTSPFPAQRKQCSVSRVTTIFMTSRKPGAKRISYYNNLRNRESRHTHRQDDVHSTTEGNGVPASSGGNGVASGGNGTVINEISSDPEVEPIPSRSLSVRIFGFRFDVPGRFILLLVPILWSSYSVCLKSLYCLDWAVSAPVFNMLRLVLAAVVVLPELSRDLGARKKCTTGEDLRAVFVAGCELGLWTVVVNIFQGYGLQFTSASRGAFLAQLATVIVPIAAFATGLETSLGWNVGVASIMAILGVGLLTLDDVSSPFNWQGDGVMLCTAFFSATYILRSKIHAEKASTGPLVPLKVIFQALFAVLYLGVASSGSLGGFSLASLSSIFTGATPLMILLNVVMIVWAGLFVSLYSTVLQMRGQALVSASEAVVIFSLTPLCASILAIPLGERFGFQGLAGAALILFSTILASRNRSEAKKSQQ